MRESEAEIEMRAAQDKKQKLVARARDPLGVIFETKIGATIFICMCVFWAVVVFSHVVGR